MTDPSTRLFLSVDVVGSTAYKQSRARGAANDVEWPALFVLFFREFPALFAEELANAQHALAEGHDFVVAPTPVLWKAIGDELVVWQPVTHEAQVTAAVVAWRDALIRFRHENLRPFRADHAKGIGIDVKAAGWLASFPSPNREVAIPQSIETAALAAGIPLVSGNEIDLDQADGADSPFALDFLGPDIDLGFRIAAHSSPRKFVVTLALAEVVAAALGSGNGVMTEALGGDVRFLYDGLVDLKGVDGGPYPLLWIDSMPGDRFAAAEDKAALRGEVSFETVTALAGRGLERSGWECAWLKDSSSKRMRDTGTRIREVAAQLDEFCQKHPASPRLELASD